MFFNSAKAFIPWDYGLYMFHPRVVACSFVLIARCLKILEAWPEKLCELTGIQFSDMRECVEYMEKDFKRQFVDLDIKTSNGDITEMNQTKP